MDNRNGKMKLPFSAHLSKLSLYQITDRFLRSDHENAVSEYEEIVVENKKSNYTEQVC